MPIILDISSSEVNRGSYCYTPYLLYSAFKALDEHKNSTQCYEDFTIAQLDDLDLTGNPQILIGLWSYPQIETAIALNLFLTEQGRNFAFFGYSPMIRALGLPEYELPLAMLELGMKTYIKNIANGEFEHILLSDCDKHLSGLEGSVYPMFTSYGCPRGCKFCSASLNTGHRRIELPLNPVFENIEIIADKGINGIHFTDEDFFFNANRAIKILQFAYEVNPDFQIIALGHASTFMKFYKKVSCDRDLFEQMKVLKLVEVGLETADIDAAKGSLGKVGVANTDQQIAVAENELCRVLWLTMTFYPGDTIHSINATGAFLRQYGLNHMELCKRIRTNGTEGGLGQFYQFYDGCGDYHDLQKNGIVLTDRPMRLWPSYLPNSFLYKPFVFDKETYDLRAKDLFYWLSVNKCMAMSAEVANELYMDGHPQRPVEIIRPYGTPYIPATQKAVILATMARLQILKGC